LGRNSENFLKESSTEGTAARTRKWQWIQQGLAAPGAADQLRVYYGYLRRMEDTLRHSEWLVGGQFSMADIAMAPYVNRLAALAMNQLWTNGRLPHVERWFERVRERSTFAAAVTHWMPPELAVEMRENGRKGWPEVSAMLAIE
jgi:glutathione S-transferase